MKLEVNNLGIVKRAEITLRPLTIFVGPNNTGKTWTAYAISLIFSPYSFLQFTEGYTSGEIKDSFAAIEDTIKHLLSQGSAKLDIVEFASRQAECYFNCLTKYSKHWLKDFWQLRIPILIT